MPLKAADGILEMVGGVLLLVLSPAAISSMVRTLTAHELSEDPDDFIATHLYRILFLRFSAGLLILAIFDGLLVRLTWREFKAKRRRRTDAAAVGV